MMFDVQNPLAIDSKQPLMKMEALLMKAELLWATPMPTQAIEYAARVCYDSHDKTKEGSAAKLVRACINKGHTASPNMLAPLPT